MESQIENKNPEIDADKIAARKKHKSDYCRNRYNANLEAMRKQRIDYYYTNRGKILANMKKTRDRKYYPDPEKIGIKYVDE